MAKTKQVSFAQQAREVVSKYEKRVQAGDEVATKSMNMELARLKRKQELAKASMSKTPMMQHNGMPMFAYGIPRELEDPTQYPTLTFAQPTIDASQTPLVNFNTPISNPSTEPEGINNNLFSTYQLGNLGSQLGTLGAQLGVVLASKPRNISVNPVTIGEYTPIQGTEALKAIHRTGENIRRTASGSPMERASAMALAQIQEADALAKTQEEIDNRNIGGRQAWENMRLETEARNVANKLATDQFNENARISYLGNISGVIGGAGTALSNAFTGAEQQEYNLAALKTASQPSYGITKLGNRYYSTRAVGDIIEYTPTRGVGAFYRRADGTPATSADFIAAINEERRNKLENISETGVSNSGSPNRYGVNLIDYSSPLYTTPSYRAIKP